MFEDKSRPVLLPLGFGIDYNEALNSVIFVERRFSPYVVHDSLIQFNFLSSMSESVLDMVIPPKVSADGTVRMSQFTGMTNRQRRRYFERQCLSQLDYWRKWDIEGAPVEPQQGDVLTMDDIDIALANLHAAFKIFEPNTDTGFQSFRQSIPWRPPYLLTEPVQINPSEFYPD